MRDVIHIPDGLDGLCFLHCAGSRERRHAHSHNEQEINLVIGGRGSYLVDGRPVALSLGSLIWLSPEQAHLLAEENCDLVMWVAVIRSDLAVLQEAGFTLQLSSDDTAFFDVLCRKLADANDPALFNTGLCYLFRQAASMLAHRPPLADLHPAVVRTVRLLKHPETVPDIDGIAKNAGMSRSQLSRLFKKQTGYTLVEYRQKMQLDLFLFLYGNGTQRNLLEAALDAGFGSYPQFYRVFQQRFGCSPRKYCHNTE